MLYLDIPHWMTLWLPRPGGYGDECRIALSIRQSRHETPITTTAITCVAIKQRMICISREDVLCRAVCHSASAATFPHRGTGNGSDSSTVGCAAQLLQVRHTRELASRLIGPWTPFLSHSLLRHLYLHGGSLPSSRKTGEAGMVARGALAIMGLAAICYVGTQSLTQQESQ